jgi:hypothetical protein
MKINRLLSFGIIVAATTFSISCRKTDQPPVDQEPINPTSVTAKFFTIPAGTNAKVKAIALIISKQNAKKEFVTGLTKRIGYPPLG